MTRLFRPFAWLLLWLDERLTLRRKPRTLAELPPLERAATLSMRRATIWRAR